MTTLGEGLQKRGKEMEESFFQRENQRLLQKLREEAEIERRREALRENLQIDDESLLDRLIELDLTVETVMAFTVIPLVVVAWADGVISRKERDAIMKAAAERGITEGSTNHQMLVDWLEHKPEPALYETWKHYAHELTVGVDPVVAIAIKEAVIKRTTAVAEAAGGFLGMNAISDQEQAVLDDIEASFA
jgi:hypothetical protein